MSVYAFSDLHGQYKLWQQIKDFISISDTVYCLGDCADRGPQGWQIIKEVLDTPNITYIRGNHEQFIIDKDYWLWRYNGGDFTIEAAEKDSASNWNKVYTKLLKTPFLAKYKNKQNDYILMCHAGLDPNLVQLWDEEELLWNRNHIELPWPQGWEKFIVIHGHTPVSYMNKFVELKKAHKQMQYGAYWYSNNHKCCIDQGSFITGKALLLDLDTFKEHIFSAEVE